MNKVKYFEAVNKMHELQDIEYGFILNGNLIEEVKVVSMNLKTYKNKKEDMLVSELILTFKGVMTKSADHFYITKEEAAEAFLKANDVPSELLRVIMPKKSDTTVARLCEKLQCVDPDTELEEDFWKILKTVEQNYILKLARED
jgi:hypothetical protein